MFPAKMGKLFSVSQLQQEVSTCFAFTVFCAHAVIAGQTFKIESKNMYFFSPELFEYGKKMIY